MPQTTQIQPKVAPSKAAPTQKSKLPLNSFGVRLFAMIMGGAFISVVSVALLFAEIVKYQAEEQIQKVLEGKVSTLREVTDRAENLAYSLGVSVSTLHIRGAQTPGTYQVLTEKLFESHPSYVLGLGFGQSEYGILPERQWFYPYYQIQSSADSLAQLSPTEPLQTTAQTEEVEYTNRADDPYSYFNSESYRRYFLPQKSVWRSPYLRDGDTLITFYSQIFGNQNEWLGTAVIDVDAAYLQAILDEAVFRQGGQLMLLGLNGQVIANPASEATVTAQTYQDIPGLNKVWSQIRNASDREQASRGLIEGDSGYWSYIRIPEQSWIVLAHVPYSAVFNRIFLITVGATLLAGLLMAGLTVLAIRYLNKYLRPVIKECQRLSIEDKAVTEKLKGKDELEQLSISFFNLLEQLQLTQTQVQLEAAHASEVESQLNQIKNRTIETQRKQRLATRKLANLLPPDPVDNTAISPASARSTQQLQQELSQLNEVVSTLAKDDWLLDTSDTRNQDLSSQNQAEVTQVNHRLSHTFLQILSAIEQFSKLLTVIGSTQGYALTIEQMMTAANQEVKDQTKNINQLYRWLEEHNTLCESIVQQTATKPLPLHLQNEIENTSQQFKQKAQMLTKQMRSLSTITENTEQKTKQYQRIANTAQILIMNASTLSISASRQQNPESFEKIVEQFHSKHTELQNLAQQLEDAQSYQQQGTQQTYELIQTLQTNAATFEQTAQQLDALAHSLQQSHTKNKSSTDIQKAKRQFSQQLTELKETLQQLEKKASTTTSQISSIMRVTEQLRQTSAALSITPQTTL